MLFVPTLAKAHPVPRLSPVSVWPERHAGQPAPTRAEGSKASPLHGIFVFLLFALLLEQTMSWPCSTGWGWWCQPGSRFAKACRHVPPPGSRACAVLVPGEAPRGGGSGTGGSRTGDPRMCPPFLMPVPLRFFDKNLKEERAGIREKLGEATGSALGRGLGRAVPLRTKPSLPRSG